MDIDNKSFSYKNKNENNENDKDITRLYGKSEMVAEHLQLLPINFLDQMYNVLNISVYRALEGIKPYLLYRTVSSNDIDSTNRSEFVDKKFPEYETRVETTIDSYFNRFQQYVLDIILHIPKNRKITLEHYQGLDLTCTDEHIELLDEELNKLRKEIISQKALKHKLVIEEQRLDKALKCLEEYGDQTKFLSTLPEKYQVNPVEDTIRNVLNEVNSFSDLNDESQ
ncbi:hypothetical protein BJ944DRAFT_260151 [Cunninghamella echinulata]|nr:hypothetical protein BJ944DRAFT_260151 [Cunninghamella echinulata]